MTEIYEVPGLGTTAEETSEEHVRVFGAGDEFDVQCEYCGLPVYYRPGICPSCGRTVAAVDQSK